MTATALQHGTTITTFEATDGLLLRSECLCGWQSTAAAERLEAMLAGADHVDGATQPPRPACPSWCTLKEGHVYDSAPANGSDALMRFHEFSMPDGWTVSRLETRCDGSVTLGPVEISYHGDERPLSVEGARRHAAALEVAIAKAKEFAD